MSGYDHLLCFIIFTSLVSGIAMETQHCVDQWTGVLLGRRHTGVTYKTATECGFQQCLALCRRRQECQSINYDKSNLSCELNHDSITDATMLTLDKEYLYVNKTTAISITKEDDDCLSNPCFPNSVCVVLHDGTTSCIDQPFPMLTTYPTTSGTTYPPSTTLPTSITTSALSAVAAACSSPYTYYGDADVCFLAVLGPNKESWLGADSFCRSNGGKLAEADSDSKISVVASLMGPLNKGWVGAKFNPNFAQITWVVSLATVEPPPTERDGDCVTVDNHGVLEARDCFVLHEFVCQKNN